MLKIDGSLAQNGDFEVVWCKNSHETWHFVVLLLVFLMVFLRLFLVVFLLVFLVVLLLVLCCCFCLVFLLAVFAADVVGASVVFVFFLVMWGQGTVVSIQVRISRYTLPSASPMQTGSRHWTAQ